MRRRLRQAKTRCSAIHGRRRQIADRRVGDGQFGEGPARARLFDLVHRGAHALDRRLAELVTEDALTGVANRRALENGLRREWFRCLDQRRPLSVLMIDVDHFKAYNDHYGHAAGDSALRRVAAVVAGAPRQPHDAAARTGGEEFLILVSQAEAGEVAAIAEHLRAAVQALAIAHADSPWGVLTVSVGWVRADPGADYAQAFLLADEALYRAKHGGRNRVQAAPTSKQSAIFSPESTDTVITL